MNGGNAQPVSDRAAVNIGRWATGVLTVLTVAVIGHGFTMSNKVDFATHEVSRMASSFEKLENRLTATDTLHREYGERLRVVETRVTDLWERNR